MALQIRGGHSLRVINANLPGTPRENTAESKFPSVQSEGIAGQRAALPQDENCIELVSRAQITSSFVRQHYHRVQVPGK